MRITLRQIEIFQTAVRHMNFSKAAKELDMSPPAITKQMKVLENQCRAPLFEHIGRRIYLTPEGEHFLKQANRVTDEMENLKKMITHNFSSENNIINLSIGHTFQNIIFDLIYKFKENNPNTEFNIHVESRSEQYENLSDNKRDFCIVTRANETDNIDIEKFIKTEFVLVASSKLPIAKKNNVSTNELAKETFILIDAERPARKPINKVLNKWDLHDLYSIELDSFVAVQGAISAQLGIGFLPETLAKKALQSGELSPVSAPKFSINIPLYIAFRKHKEMSPIQKEFMAFLKNEAKEAALA